ncbi:MAG TPA: response regulator [Chthoniobacterales bacterium]|nr:response regulator [Chthoniobacterales bacterium]
MMVRPRLADIKILLIEAHPALREAVTKYLSYQGAEVRSYSNPDDASAGIDFCPHILLCEITIPAQSAFLLLKNLRRSVDRTDFKILAVGLFGLGSSAERSALSAGFDAVLQKPFGPAELLQLLSRLLLR